MDKQPSKPPPVGDLLGQIEELLQVKAAFNANSLPPAARKASLIGFWRQIHAIIAVNPASVGLKTLDEIAEALINEDEEGAKAFFDGLTTLLPDPARQQSGGVPVDHEVFPDTPKRSRSPSHTEQQGGVLVPKAGSHAIKKLKVDFGLSSGNKTTTVSSTKETEKLPVPKKKKATPTRQSDKFLPDKKRKKKATNSADQTSAEETAAELTEALQTKEEEDPDAKVLREKLAIVKKDLDDGKGVDLVKNAYPWSKQYLCSLPSLLELTDVLNLEDKPMNGPEYRQSDLALAFVLWDVTSTQQVPSHWSGDITKGVWLKLTQSERIRDLPIKIEREVVSGTYESPTVTPYDESESKVEGLTPFKNFNGSYTAQPPLNKIAPWVDKRDEVITLDEEAEVEDGEVEGDEVSEEDAPTGVSTRSGRGHLFMRPSRADSAKSKSK
ncbi:hypothetical protein PHMEG_00015658 [Phytophthora megakarya]|uniref:Uncharacterized protein n=1 Tax=Phytophthora megakarya TaxID=4795 RepID=A0A225W298_9STRA|nr:hypothetical protein PHMEG_00015658 [Phytophthora megakarya]